jgi:hypothetical protein
MLDGETANFRAVEAALGVWRQTGPVVGDMAALQGRLARETLTAIHAALQARQPDGGER